MKPKKKGIAGKIILAVLLIVLVVFGVSIALGMSKMKNMTIVEPVEIKKADLENTVTFSGVVESNVFEKVTSGINLPVQTVNVKEGDVVKKGDILATLDSSTIEDEILQQQANIDSSSVSSSYVVSDAERQYIETAAQIQNGTYPEIYSAKVTLDNAKSRLANAQRDYDDQVSRAGSDKDNSLIGANQQVESSKRELDYAKEDLARAQKERADEDYSSIRNLKKAYEDAQKEYDERFDKKNRDEVQKARDAYEQAQERYAYLANGYANGAYDVTAKDLEAAKNDVPKKKADLEAVEKKYDVKTKVENFDDALVDYTNAKAKIDSNHDIAVRNAERAVERAENSVNSAENQVKTVLDGNDTKATSYAQAIQDAQKSVDQAQDAYDVAVKRANNTLSELKAAADKQRVLSNNNSSQLIALEILKERLDKCVIYAPCDGVVTQCNAIVGTVVGGANTNILFIIEDTNDLKFVSSVKEFSVGQLTEDADVDVTIPALDMELKGKIDHVSVAGVKNAEGKSDGSASFIVNTNILDTKDTGVLIGMTAKGKIVTDSVKDVYAVSYDCIAEEEDGGAHICVAEEDPETKLLKVRFIPVTTGFEANAEVEIQSSELTDGMKVLPNAAEYTEGQTVLTPEMAGQPAMGA